MADDVIAPAPVATKITIDAAALLERLRSSGSPITGIALGDLNDSTTWQFDGRKLTQPDVAYAVAIIREMLAEPPDPKDPPVEPLPPPAPPPQPTTRQTVADAVSNLLAESRASHLAWRQGQRLGNMPEARIALERASQSRTDAAILDPGLRAPAWREDAKTHPHTELLAFYAEQLRKR